MPKFKRFFPCAAISFLSLSLLFALPLAADDSVYVERQDGILDGAPYSLWMPSFNNNILYVYAPGYRPEAGTREITFDAQTDPVIKDLLPQGWTVATTVYRSNGWVVGSGINDLRALIEHATTEAGPFRYVLVEGHSMGGLIALHLAEEAEEDTLVSGVLVVGSSVVMEESRLRAFGGKPADLDYTFEPIRPVLFVSNFNELEGPLTYVGRASAGPAHRFAAAKTIERMGHVNVTDEERAAALTWIYNWVSGEPPARLGDLTIEVIEAVGGGVLGDDRVEGTITRLDPDFGNIDVNISFRDLNALGVDFGSLVAVQVGEEIRMARVSDRYAGVPQGDWVIVVLPNGLLRLAINMGNASQDIQGFPDDTLILIPAQSME
jgi:pimeloyl-ACP methyl ester carboxylesterase